VSDVVVADTNVISYILKGHTLGLSYSSLLAEHTTFVSFMTDAELQRWAYIRKWGEGRQGQLAELLRTFTVIHSDADLCNAWARAMTDARQRGRRIETADAWIAATALLHDAPLVTHNPTDFAGLPSLRLITLAER